MEGQDLVGLYLRERRKSLKRIAKQLREDAGLSKQALARLLGCARTRIIDVENEESTNEYSTQELELLAILCGKHPLEVLKLTGQEAIDLGKIVSAQQTGTALLNAIDCQLPECITQIYADADYFPAPVVFSPDGSTLAIVADDADAERWADSHTYDDPYHYTIVVWDANSGERIGERRMPYAEHIAVLDNTRLAIATSRPLGEFLDARDYEGEYQLQIWNIHSDTIEQTFSLLDRVGNLAVSPDGKYLAAFFPTTTTIQVWYTSNWQPIHAFELETLKGDPESLGSLFRPTVEMKRLPRERKFDRWLIDYSANRFEFTDNDVLVIGFYDRMREFSMSHPNGLYDSPIEYPLIPWSTLAHIRNGSREIAITKMNSNADLGVCQIELYYLEARGKRHPLDTYIQRFGRRLIPLMSFRLPSAWEDLAPDSHSAKTTRKHRLP